MAAPFDPFASFVPVEVDPSTLRWPWDPEPAPAAPAPDPAATAQATPVEPAAIEVPAPIPLPPAEPAPPPMPEPPADTGALLPGLGIPAAAAEGAVAGEQRYGEAANALDASPFDEATGDVRADVSDADLERYATDAAMRGDATFATKLADFKAKRALDERSRVLEENAKAREANLKMNEEALKAAQAKSAAIEADAARINATKLEPKDMGIAGVIMGIIGGLIQGRTGSARNMGIDALNDIINRDLEVQKAALAGQREGIAARRSALANEMALHGDMFRAQEAVRLAKLDQAEQQLAIEQQKYAPRGTTAAKIAGLRAQVAAARGEAQRKIAQQNLDNELKLRRQLLDEQQHREVSRHNRASEYLQGRQIDSAAEDRRIAREQRAEDKAAERAEKTAERERQFSIGGIPRVKVGADGKPVMGADGKPTIDYDVLRNTDGSVWLAPSSEAERELRTKKTTSTEVVSIIDEIRAIRRRVGGESRVLNSREAQRLKVLKARAQLLTKQGTQGMSSDKDMETIEDAAGTVDADSWRDQEGKLEEARARTLSALNQAFRDAKYNGEAIDFPEAKPTESTVDEIRFQGLLEKPNESIDEARRQIETARSAGFPDIGYNPDASIKQQIGIAELGQDAAGPANDDRATLARTRLQKLAAEAPTSALRQLARVTLESALRAGISSSEETTTSTGARDIRGGERSTATPVPDELRVR